MRNLPVGGLLPVIVFVVTLVIAALNAASASAACIGPTNGTIRAGSSPQSAPTTTRL